MVLAQQRAHIFWNTAQVHARTHQQNLDVGRLLQYRTEIGTGKKRRFFGSQP